MHGMRNKFVKNLQCWIQVLPKGEEDTEGLSCEERGEIYWALQGIMFGSWELEGTGSVTVCIPLP